MTTREEIQARADAARAAHPGYAAQAKEAHVSRSEPPQEATRKPRTPRSASPRQPRAPRTPRPSVPRRDDATNITVSLSGPDPDLIERVWDLLMSLNPEQVIASRGAPGPQDDYRNPGQLQVRYNTLTFHRSQLEGM